MIVSRVYQFLRGGDEPIKTTIIGGFLWYFGVFFMVPAVFIMGYLMRVIRVAGQEDRALPVFDRWRELFVDGVKVYVILGIYLLLPLLNQFLISRGVTEANAMLIAFVVILTGGGIFAILIPFGLGASSTIVEDVIGTSQQSISIDVLGTLTEDPSVFLLLFLVWYVIPAALGNFAQERTLLSGFDFNNIRQTVRHGRYAATWIGFFPLWWITVLWWRIPWFDQFAAFFAVRGQPRLGEELASLLVIAGFLFSFVLLAIAFTVLGVTWNSLQPTEDQQEPKTTGQSASEDTDVS